MKLVRFGEEGKEKPGILDGEGRIRDLSLVVGDVDRELLGDLDRLRTLDLETLPLAPEGVRLGPCFNGIGNFLCIGLNYRKHAEETGMALPKEPVLFMKATGAISGPQDPILLPPGSLRTDWEVELGVVIGRRAKRVGVEEALAHVAGYCVVNDVSERDLQMETGQWIRGKSHDSFGPVGPWFVTADEVPDPQDLGLWLELNGERVQDSNTQDMIFSVAELVSRLSQVLTLQPGDLISTGTPSGVGMGMKPPRHLREGDVVELGIQGMGVQRQKVKRDE
ncbi:fumarylacetoacetate hydrolase family protein [Anaerotalea alkaliphila]|uniref:Fumarylacetoacetate hydrolase family protein n=1 Tax=Anaerotalea alkaliphila TaxID=2662126 RepID=A0A7X5KLB0_9FIRM|nr:fumarylacetoacetate hydrolase family protein [Anaerotalea alkaliphila]NDL66646.1 fumarylacetoacetate hydrolase family protein [Anaerotalea alkaliphila]